MAFRPLPEHELWIADVAVVSAERATKISDDEYLRGAPDLVVHMVLPEHTLEDITERMSICLENGCRGFWLVDAKHKSLDVTEGDITRHYGIDASFHCDVLGATVSVREIFE